MMIDASHPMLTIQNQCALLGLARSSHYYEPKPLSPEIERLMKLLDQHYT